MSDHTIIIRQLGRAYSVEVEPPHPDHPPRVFGDPRSALGCAGGLRIVTGWKKLDLSGEAQA